jgi:hypothetical protein
MKLTIEVSTRDSEETNDEFLSERGEEWARVPFLIKGADIRAAYPSDDKQHINIYFGDWMAVRYSDKLWAELEALLHPAKDQK